MFMMFFQSFFRMAFAMDNPKADPEPYYRQQADRETRHAAGLR